MYKKNYFFLIFVVILWGFFLDKIIPRSVDKNIEVSIYQVKHNMKDLYDTSGIKEPKKIFIDQVNFLEGTKLTHYKLGDLGFGKNIFLKVNTVFNVKEDGDYFFYVGSDDGFDLIIDNKMVLAHPQNRGFAFSNKQLHLNRGNHTFFLRYYQGYGPMGLRVEYRNLKDRKRYVFGEDSKYFDFKELK